MTIKALRYSRFPLPASRFPLPASRFPFPDSRPPATMPPITLADWLAYIERQHPRSIDMGLERVREIAGRMRLGRPGRHVITVGGTNGKGSTVAFIEAIARAAGWRVGAYTSPHLLAYNERVRIDGRNADDAALVSAFAAVEAARTGATYAGEPDPYKKPRDLDEDDEPDEGLDVTPDSGRDG
jgi:hypothetical protein